MQEEYSLDEENRVITFKDSKAQNKKANNEISLLEKLVKTNDKSIKEEAKQLKGILVNKSYTGFEGEGNLIDNNLAVQGRKKYESKQHVLTESQQSSRTKEKTVDMMQLLQTDIPNQQTITKIESMNVTKQQAPIQGIKLDKLKNRYNQPTKISKEDMMMIEESDEEQIFATNALDEEENRRDFEEELFEHENQGKEEQKPKELAGWGDWAGHGVKAKKVEEKPAEPKKLTLNRKRTNMIVNESLPKSFRKYMVDELPHEYKNKDQFNFEVGLALGSEWNGLKNSKNFCKPKVVNNAGDIITPLNMKNLPKAKFL